MLYHQTLRSIHLNSELVKNQEGLKKQASFILVSIINAKINNIWLFFSQNNYKIQDYINIVSLLRF